MTKSLYTSGASLKRVSVVTKYCKASGICETTIGLALTSLHTSLTIQSAFFNLTGKNTQRAGLISHASLVFSRKDLSGTFFDFQEATISSPGTLSSDKPAGFCQVLKNSIWTA